MINFLEPPFVYYLFVGLALGIGIVIFRKVKMPKKDIKFQGQTLNEVVEKENLTPYLNRFGRKTKKGKLITASKIIKVNKMVQAKFKYKDIKYTKYTKNISTKEGDFLIFQSVKSKFSGIPLINIIFGKPEYYIINNDSNITKDEYRDVWVLPPSNFFYSLAGIWVNSLEGKDFVNELVYKKTFENIKEEDMNYVKRIVWYNDIYASNMTSTEQSYELEKKKWSDRVERETGVKQGAG